MKIEIINYDHGGLIGYGHWEGKERIIRDINEIQKLIAEHPFYKTGLDAEAYTYEDDTLAEVIRSSIKENNGNFDLIGGTYGQPLLWSIHPEAIIRQFFIGKEVVWDKFQEDIKYYGGSEQTFFPQLVQILSSLGYEGILFRTHFTMYGYCETFNKSSFFWVSPCSKYQIKCIPTYDSQYFPTKDFGGTTVDNWCITRFQNELFRRLGCSGRTFEDLIKKCHSNGVERPIFSRIDDYELISEKFLKRYRDRDVAFLTADEAFKSLNPQESVSISPNQIKTRLGWGMFADRLWKWEKKTVTNLLITEAMNFFTLQSKDSLKENEDNLHLAWKKALRAQHHDLNVVPTSRSKEGEMLKDISSNWFKEAHLSCENIKNNLFHIIAKSTPSDLDNNKTAKSSQDESMLIIFNPAGLRRDEYVEIDMETGFERADAIPEIADVDGNVVSYQIISQIKSGVKNILKLALRVELEAFEKKAYRVRYVGKIEKMKENKVMKSDITNGYYKFLLNEGNINIQAAQLTINPYFSASIDGENYRSNLTFETIQDGPHYFELMGQGWIQDIPLKLIIKTFKNSEHIDFKIETQFQNQTIGEKMVAGKVYTLKDHPEFNHRMKLRLHLQSNLNDPVCVSDSPFYIYQPDSPEVNSYFFAGLFEGKNGFILLNKGDQGYIHDKGDLSVVLAYSGPCVWELEKVCESAYLTGQESFEFTMVASSSGYRASDLQKDATKVNLPIQTQVINMNENHSLPKGQDIKNYDLQIKNIRGEALISSAYLHKGKRYIRIFECQGEPSEGQVSLSHGENKFECLEVNLAHHSQGKLNDGVFSLEPWEIKTFLFE